jgi:hypothetical protein
LIDYFVCEQLIADRSDARKYVAVGMLLTAALNFFVRDDELHRARCALDAE